MIDMTRGRLDQQLELLNQELIEMGAMCETAIANAVKALVDGDLELADEAVAIDQRIDEKEREIEVLCLKFMLRQQPVARDLRQVSSALKMITDMERIGDQARDIAEITRYIRLRENTNQGSIGDMARATIKMVTESIDAFVRQDLELAKAVIAHDDVVDAYFLTIRQELIGMIHSDPNQGEYALDVLMIAKYFERIGDHATNIAEWVEFSITGVHSSQGDSEK